MCSRDARAMKDRKEKQSREREREREKYGLALYLYTQCTFVDCHVYACKMYIYVTMSLRKYELVYVWSVLQTAWAWVRG